MLFTDRSRDSDRVSPLWKKCLPGTPNATCYFRTASHQTVSDCYTNTIWFVPFTSENSLLAAFIYGILFYAPPPIYFLRHLLDRMINQMLQCKYVQNFHFYKFIYIGMYWGSSEVLSLCTWICIITKKCL